MSIVPRVDITAEDLREESRKQGLEPDKWNYMRNSKGYYEIRKGAFIVGDLIFEDHAQILIDALNKQP